MERAPDPVKFTHRAFTFLLVGRYFHEKNQTHWLSAIGLAGAPGIVVSHPALFVFGGAFLATGFDSLARRNWTVFRLFLLMSAATAASLGLDSLVSLKLLSSNSYLRDFWQKTFAPLHPRKDLPWFSQVWKRILYDPLKLPSSLFRLFHWLKVE